MPKQPHLIFVFGGARSGKSGASEAIATAEAARLGSQVTYIATAEARDMEMVERVARHRARRSSTWQTIEEPYALASILQESSGVYLIDCLTLFITNWLLKLEQEGLQGTKLEDACLAKVDELVQAALTCRGCVVVVGNEVGQGVVPAYPLGRIFRDIAGRANQLLVAAADEAHYCLAGVCTPIKPRVGLFEPPDETQQKISASVSPIETLPTSTQTASSTTTSTTNPPPAPFFEAPALAMQFLTRIPGPVGYLVPNERLVESLVWFPAVGALLGLIGSLFILLLQHLYPPEVSAALVLTAIIVITGNFHFDGLMDTADGIYGGYTSERRLEIMRDSRVGAHGVAAGILATLLKWTLLTVLIEKDVAIWALPLVLASARWCLVYTTRTTPPARKDGFAAIYSSHLRNSHVWKATAVWVAMVVFVLTAMRIVGIWPVSIITYTAITALALAFATAHLLSAYVKRKLGGMTGDTLGSVNELAEIVILLMLAAWL